MDLAYAAEGLTQIINSIFYANDPEELERANTRAKQYYARYTTPAMRAPENMEELLWDVAGTAYGNMLQNKLFSSLGSTGVGTKAADAVLTNTGNQRLAKAIGRSVDDVMAGLPINVLQGLIVDGDTEDKIRAMAKGALYDALSGYASSRIEDIAGDAYAWLGKNRASKSGATDLATMSDDEYYRLVTAHMDAIANDTSAGRAVPDNISAPGQTSDGLTDDEYFRMLQWYVDEGPREDYYQRISTMVEDADENNLIIPQQSDMIELYRNSKNTGAFSALSERMTKKNIRQLAKKYSIDLEGITLNIDRNEDLLRIPYAGRADPEKIGGITFFPNAFRSEEDLLRTICHEKTHVEQFKQFGVKYVQENRAYFENLAYAVEDEFIATLKRKGDF